VGCNAYICVSFNREVACVPLGERLVAPANYGIGKSRTVVLCAVAYAGFGGRSVVDAKAVLPDLATSTKLNAARAPLDWEPKHAQHARLSVPEFTTVKI